MSASTRELEARKIAAVVAAVQAYLESEARASRLKPAVIGAWRGTASAGSDGDAFTSRHRSWTGRD